MKQRIKRLLREKLPLASAGELRELNDRVAALEQELDEYRRDSLRVAEMLDLVEERLTPGATSTADTTSTGATSTGGAAHVAGAGATAGATATAAAAAAAPSIDSEK